jgi:hypothetical protein
MRSYLKWPEETAGKSSNAFKWSHPGSNLCLDFHGNPDKAQLVVFSDGNHHMALRECLDSFSDKYDDLSNIFYATTPPGPIVNMLKLGGLQLGNLTIDVQPDVFISPPNILDSLVDQGFMKSHTPFVQNRGNVLLVRKGNPRQISEASHIMDKNIRLFISHPEKEKASYTAYYDTLKALVSSLDPDTDFLQEKVSQGQVIFGECIHHREAPQAVAEGSADVAPVFYHLALRYVRIFPENFDIVPLGGKVDAPDPLPGNVVARTSIGLVGDGGIWGGRFLKYLLSDEAANIYESHGLSSRLID